MLAFQYSSKAGGTRTCKLSLRVYNHFCDHSPSICCACYTTWHDGFCLANLAQSQPLTMIRKSAGRGFRPSSSRRFRYVFVAKPTYTSDSADPERNRRHVIGKLEVVMQSRLDVSVGWRIIVDRDTRFQNTIRRSVCWLFVSSLIFICPNLDQSGLL
jgi:hypothetical protein